MNNLRKVINKIVNEHRDNISSERLRAARAELGRLCNKEEIYWVQRSKIKWLKEGD